MDPNASPTPDKPPVPEQTNPNPAPSTVIGPASSPPAGPEGAGAPVTVTGSDGFGQPVLMANPRPGRGKKLALFGGITAVIVAAAAAYLVGFYLPNRPQNVFATSLERTGEYYDRLTSYLKQNTLADEYKGAQASGTFKVKSPGFATDGSFESKGDGKNATFKVDVGMVTTRLKFEGMLKDAPNATTPDAYFKLSGIKGLGKQIGMANLDSLDNQWITVDHTLFDSVSGQYMADAKKDGLILPNQEDMKEAYNVAGQVFHKYLFTGGQDAVFEMKSYVGKEKLDGEDNHHYKVGINKDNLKKFADELGRELDKTKLNNWAKENIGQSLSQVINIEDIKNADSGLKDKTADLWVNADTKLISKVRLTAEGNSQRFVEFGMPQKEGAYPFFMKFQDDDGVVNLSFNLSTETHAFSVKADFSEGKDNEATTGSFEVTAKPFGEDVKVATPAGAINLNQALERIGLSEYLNMIVNGRQSNVQPLPLEGPNSPLYNLQ